jgi:hypothetical protein
LEGFNVGNFVGEKVGGPIFGFIWPNTTLMDEMINSFLNMIDKVVLSTSSHY